MPVAFFYPFSEDIKLDLSENTSPLLWTPEAVNLTVGDFLEYSEMSLLYARRLLLFILLMELLSTAPAEGGGEK